MMFGRFTERAQRVLMLAQEEAKYFGHSYVGTEHILLGIIKGGEGNAFMVLQNAGVTLEKVREEHP